MVMVKWVPVVILVVAILVDKILQNGLVFFRRPSKFWRPVCRYLQPLPAHFLLPKLSRRASFALFQGKGEQRIELRVVSESHTLDARPSIIRRKGKLFSWS